MAHQRPLKPDLHLLAPRPLKQSVGSPLTPRRLFDDCPTTTTTNTMIIPNLVDQRFPFEAGYDSSSSTSKGIFSPESFDEKPEIREIYLAAEEELKEIVEGFTHSYVHNLIREGQGNLLGEEEEEDNDSPFDRDDFPMMMDRDYLSGSSRGSSTSSVGCDTPIFPMEELPHLGGSPSPALPERLSADIRNYSFLDDNFEEECAEDEYWEYYPEEEGYGSMENHHLFVESRWITETPPLRAANPVTKDLTFGSRLIVTTQRDLAPSEEPPRNDWKLQRRKRIMSEPPQRGGAPFSNSSIECF